MIRTNTQTLPAASVKRKGTSPRTALRRKKAVQSQRETQTRKRERRLDLPRRIRFLQRTTRCTQRRLTMLNVHGVTIANVGQRVRRNIFQLSTR